MPHETEELSNTMEIPGNDGGSIVANVVAFNEEKQSAETIQDESVLNKETTVSALLFPNNLEVYACVLLSLEQQENTQDTADQVANVLLALGQPEKLKGNEGEKKKKEEKDDLPGRHVNRLVSIITVMQ